MPKRIYIEPRALEYPLGRSIERRAREWGIEVRRTTSHNQIRGLPGRTPKERYWLAKQTLVVGVRKGTAFATSRPSADFQLPLATGCPGHCHYCYLNTNLSQKPYVRVYVNYEDVLRIADRYIAQHAPEMTTFDGSCTSDPVAVEYWSRALETAITHFADQPLGLFRFVTKYTAVQPLLGLRHNGRTRARFSLNTPTVAAQFEKSVPRVERRIAAAEAMAGAGYRLGFLIAPVMRYPGWQAEYGALLERLAEDGERWQQADLRFEVVLHRFTPRAKQTILEVYPQTQLEMDEAQRRWKWGQFGYGKYLYPTSFYEEATAFFTEAIARRFPYAQLDYIV